LRWSTPGPLAVVFFKFNRSLKELVEGVSVSGLESWLEAKLRLALL